MDRFRATFIVLFLSWAVPRVYYRIKGRGRVQEKVREKWAFPARIFLGLPFMVGVALYMFHPQALRRMNFPISDFWRWTGAVIFALASALMIWVHVTLGKNFSSELRIRSDQELVTWGPYRHVRHPMYTAFFLLMIGMGLLSANWLIGAGVLGVAVLIVFRLHTEEEMMARAFGERYRQYAAVTGRFLPRLRGGTAKGLGAAS
jgi:protein-S-isoprenylcysteine O-methyltransferase Ste14